MLVENRMLLKNLNPKTYFALNHIESKLSNVRVFPSKKGDATLAITIDNKEYLYHSKYDPKREAQTFVDKLISDQHINDVKNIKHLLFIGIGLGYHFEMIMEKFPYASFSIFEPNIEVLHTFLSKVNLSKYKVNKIKEVFTNIDQINHLNNFLDLSIENSMTIILPISFQLYSNEIESFQGFVKDNLKQRKAVLATKVSFQQRWTINSIVNFPEVVKTPNFFEDINSHLLKDKPVIIVAAGPSLSLEIEHLRRIKEEGRAYLFAVGSAVNALIEAKIFPDAFFSYDPGALNAKVVSRIKEGNLDIPLVFGTSIGYEVLEDYPGKKIHFLTSQDTFSHHLLKVDTTNTVPDAKSIAIITLYILLKLKVSTIILVGQNLGFVNNKRYANEINYNFLSNELSEKEKENILFIESVNGGKIETDELFLMMKKNMENVIKNMNSSSEIINTTKNGAKIAGTTFMPLEEVIEKKLQRTNITGKEWLQGKQDVDMEFVRKRYNNLEYSFDEMISAFNDVIQVQNEIIEDYKKGIFTKLESQFVRFDKAFNKVKNSEFFKVIIKPMTRVQHEDFLKHSYKVQAAHLPNKKAENFINIFIKYTNAIYAAIIYIQPAFKKLKESNIFNVKENVK
ncbi:6-hydroxymethylpterin diphosphokinase MptE-like protein [Ureibacillus sp. FSL W7-1570]|uniref:motility associated factor glycosyltransferase family protein n=1 Tax=Ureibacillus sp. FSL W7-1570 TaxID=2954593 RepID=UPI00315A154F